MILTYGASTTFTQHVTDSYLFQLVPAEWITILNRSTQQIDSEEREKAISLWRVWTDCVLQLRPEEGSMPTHNLSETSNDPLTDPVHVTFEKNSHVTNTHWKAKQFLS